MNQVKGFTLIELVTVAIIMGVVAVGVSGFMRTGFAVYSDAAARETIISQSRFVIERLNRELRTAVPGSVRVTANSACIEFVPFVEVGSYLELPVDSAGASGLLIRQDPEAAPTKAQHNLVIYPTRDSDVYVTGGKSHPITSVDYDSDADNNTFTVSFDPEVKFTTHAPQRRFYTYDTATSYCYIAATGEPVSYTHLTLPTTSRV